MAGKFDWLKNALIKEEEQKPETTPKTDNSLQFQARFNTSPTVNQVVSQPMVIDTGVPDQSYLDHLYKFMEDQNIPGPDYFEYANTLHEMGQMAGGIPEANLYQLAYVGLKAQGVTPTQLVSTAGKYISLFEKHKSEFEAYLSKDGSAQITAKTQEIQTLEQNNKVAEAKLVELTQQIQSIQQQMVANAQKIAENTSSIQNDTQVITGKKIKFEKAYQIVVDKVNGDIQKIQNYVK